MSNAKESSMKKALLFSAMGIAAATGATVASAQEVGRVISSTPVIQQVAVPRQVCNQPVAVQQPNTGAGGVVGGLAGGAIGNQFGHGDGRAVATILGVVGGALLGNQIESNNNPPQVAQQCGTQTTYENRTVAYNVTYEYAGRQYTTQMPYDPGATVRLQVSPVADNGAPIDSTQGAQPIMSQGQSQVPQAVILASPPPTVVYPAAYPAYYPQPYYYPPVGISLGFGFGLGGHGHRHWR
jgi:uncharacterized protein YcfJ